MAILQDLSTTATARQNLTYKVGAKGGVSVYGLGRFPVTLYVDQWRALIDELPHLMEFIEANAAALKTNEPA